MRTSQATETTPLAGGGAGQPLRFRDIDGRETDALTRLRLADAWDVERAHGGDLRVAAGRLPVHEQHDGLPVAGHLDGATVRRVVAVPGRLVNIVL